jgi:hypothetical protein
MRRRRIRLRVAIGLLLVCAAAACGRYGKPVRSHPSPEPSEHAQAIEKR